VGSVVLFCAVADACSSRRVSWAWRRPWGRALAWRAPWPWRAPLFLAVYGWQALRRARQVHRLDASAAGSSLSLGAAVAQAAAFTLLNPHVYLDTVLLVGSIGAQQPAALRGWFIAGAAGPAWSGSRCWASALDGWRRGSPGRGPGRCWTA
jgi:L-lysine exporter family protein LysE/ArgO